MSESRSVFDLRSPAARIVIARAQGGDAAALDAVLRSLQEPLFVHVLGIVRDDDVAKDTLQDALLVIARKLSHVNDPRWLRAWAYRIATREAVRHARMTTRWKAELDGDALEHHAADAPLEPLYDAELIAQLPVLVATLGPASQAVLRMHYLDEMTYVEIAEALEIPVGTVKSRLASGLESLRKRLGLTRSAGR